MGQRRDHAQSRSSQIDVEKAYKFGKELGTGNFAVVKVAVKKDTGKAYAVKIINKALCAGKEDMIETEIAILKKVKHKHVVGMLEEFDTPDKLYLILDLVEGGELFDRIVDAVCCHVVLFRLLSYLSQITRRQRTGQLHRGRRQPNHAPDDRGDPVPARTRHRPSRS